MARHPAAAVSTALGGEEHARRRNTPHTSHGGHRVPRTPSWIVETRPPAGTASHTRQACHRVRPAHFPGGANALPPSGVDERARQGTAQHGNSESDGREAHADQCVVFRTWVYASKPLEIEWCSTNLTSGLLMPMPKLMVHTITWGAASRSMLMARTSCTAVSTSVTPMLHG